MPQSRTPLLLFTVLLATVAACQIPRELPNPTGSELYSQTLPGVAWIESPGEGKGTGWLIDRDRRWLVTCYHVVGEAKSVDAFFPMRRDGAIVAERSAYLEPRKPIRGTVLVRSPKTDLALIELGSVPADAVALHLANAPEPGARVHVIGNRYDVDSLWVYGTGVVRQRLTLHEGYFSGGKRLARGAQALLASVPINEGDSGGPLLDDRGRVVGVCAALSWEAQGAGLFIDSSDVAALLAEAKGPKVLDDRTTGSDVYAQTVHTLALVRQTESGKRATGWLLDQKRRLLLTTAEVVGSHESAEVVLPLFEKGQVVGAGSAYKDSAALAASGQLVTGYVLAIDARRNVALVELASLPPTMTEATFADARSRPGEPLHLLSNPDRIEVLWAYGSGWVRQFTKVNLGQTKEGPDPVIMVVQAPLTEGEGGGPVFSNQGKVVAQITGKSGPQQQLSYCLEASEIQAFLKENRATWQPRDAEELCRRGERFAKARLPERAIVDFTEALKINPKFARALSGRGRERAVRGEYAAALHDCSRALDLDPQRSEAFVGRSLAHLGRAEYQQARADCDAALKIDPKNAAAFSQRAVARLRLDDVKGATKDCEEALWLSPGRADVYFHRGLIHAETGDRDAALSDFGRAIDLDPRQASFFAARGDLYRLRSDHVAALADYERAVAQDRNCVGAHWGKAMVLGGRGEVAAALQAYRTAAAAFWTKVCRGMRNP